MSVMPPFVVVGGGIAGLACARYVATTAGGPEVVVLDRGRRLGGRMAVRTHDGHAVDTGASYFTVSDDRFAAQVRDWESRGLVREWTDTFHTADASGLTGTKSGPVRWAATHGLRSLVEDLATGLDVRQQEVRRVGPGTVDGVESLWTVLAMPDPQAHRLLADELPEVAAVATRDWNPALALAARFDARTWPEVDGVFVADHPVLSWIADDGRRRGDDAPVLVAHTTPEFASRHLEDPQAALPEVLGALRDVLGIEPEPTWTYLQRWSLSNPADPREEPFWSAEDGRRVSLCGDGWHAPSKVEAAYLSGLELGLELAGDGTIHTA
ncbi:NAD(P)/FAD-dependent oxidoreductase [Solicola sp. PLA-1-18]|uniref:NAD(P)/FAD-dependent oxidoreductase n=1 Tax=Solicola sp. PLA-1-18 TaxID=3380532 RepID=UPI003B776E65